MKFQKEGIFDTLTGTNFVLIIIRILSISIKIRIQGKCIIVNLILKSKRRRHPDNT